MDRRFVDYPAREEGFEIIERDDGFVSPSPGPEIYFTRYDEWTDQIRDALEHLGGRVLDVDCGAGRYALYAQDQGYDTVGKDVSPGAVAVCRDPHATDDPDHPEEYVAVLEKA